MMHKFLFLSFSKIPLTVIMTSERSEWGKNPFHSGEIEQRHLSCLILRHKSVSIWHFLSLLLFLGLPVFFLVILGQSVRIEPRISCAVLAVGDSRFSLRSPENDAKCHPSMTQSSSEGLPIKIIRQQRWCVAKVRYLDRLMRSTVGGMTVKSNDIVNKKGWDKSTHLFCSI